MLLTSMVLLELFEFFWQKGNSLKDYMQSLLNAFQKSTILFICLHPSFFFVLFCIFALNIKSPFLLAIGGLKFFDIGFKIYILDRVSKGMPLGIYKDMFNENINISNMSKILSSAFYVFLFYLAINNPI